MALGFPLAPRYRLDDESPWLKGIDPLRNYWIAVNGDFDRVVPIAGLNVASEDKIRQVLQQLWQMQPGEQLQISSVTSILVIHCISQNCYAIASTVEGAAVWHLFDQETLESLLRTSHPDWQCASADLELGRQMLQLAWESSVAA